MECSAIPAKVVAACFALVSFAAAAVVGAVSQTPTSTVIWRSLVVMGVCYVAGLVLGALVQRIVDGQIEQYKLTHPIPPDATEEMFAVEADGAEESVEMEPRDGEAEAEPQQPSALAA